MLARLPEGIDAVFNGLVLLGKSLHTGKQWDFPLSTAMGRSSEFLFFSGHRDIGKFLGKSLGGFHSHGGTPSSLDGLFHGKYHKQTI